MEKKILLFCLMIFVLGTGKLMAQKNNTLFGGNIIVGFPTGSFGDSYTSALGFEGFGGIGLGENLYALASLGYVSYAAESYNPYGRVTLIPIKAGLRYYATKNLFLTGNAGVGLIKDQDMISRESRFAYDVGAGFQFSKFQAGLYYDGWKRQNTSGSSNSILLKFGIAIE
jgi:hypothetical protein